MIRIVGSLTTMPDKFSKIVRTLQSLHDQTRKLDAIYLSLPTRSRRLNVDYPPIPKEIGDLCTIVPCGDYGPITKLLGGILSENDPSTVIISFDDDMIYPRTIVQALLNHHEKYPDSALGSSGMLLKYECPMCAITPNEDNFLYRVPKFATPPEGRRVDSIYGYPGALYVRKFFPMIKNSNNQQESLTEILEKEFLNYALINHDMFMNDDIVISGYLSLRGIERRIFPNMPTVSFVLDEENGIRLRTESEISYNLDKFFQRMNASIATSKALGMYSITESVDVSETVVGISIVLVLSILVMVVFIIYIIRSPTSNQVPFF